MSLYRHLVWPLVRRIDAEWVHERALSFLAAAQAVGPGRWLLRALAGEVPQRPVELWGLRFPHPLGVAAGFDKDARVARALAELGFGHVEVGTLTPRPQRGNPRPRVFRLPLDQALVNRMGFPNRGAAAAAARLAALGPAESRGFVLGVSLGKQKETPLAEAAGDYLEVMRQVYARADYLAVNVSSPNTPGLRELQGGRHVHRLVGELVAEGRRLGESHGRRRPLLVKVAPDLEPGEIDEILEAVEAHGIDGIIATNTTLRREGLGDPRQREAGGLSGRPLARRATEAIAYIHRQTGGRLPIVGVGGVFSARDLAEKLDAGASLVQVYTGFIYRGPGMAGELVRGLGA